MTRHRRVSLLGVEGGADSCKKRPRPKKIIAHWVSVPAYNTAGEILIPDWFRWLRVPSRRLGARVRIRLRTLLGAQSLAGRHSCSRLGKLLLAPPTRHAESEAMVCLTRRQRAGAGGGRVQCVDPSLQPSRCVTSQRVPGVTRGRRQAPSCLTLNVTPDQRKVEQSAPRHVSGVPHAQKWCNQEPLGYIESMVTCSSRGKPRQSGAHAICHR